jgi:hypothetical protein
MDEDFEFVRNVLKKVTEEAKILDKLVEQEWLSEIILRAETYLSVSAFFLCQN